MTEELTRREHVTAFIRRFVTYQPVITYFGGNSIGLALGEAAGALGEYATGMARGLRRRFTLLGAQGTDLTEVLDEHGAPRLGSSRSRVLLVFRPWSFNVLDIVPNGLVHDVEVDAAGPTEVGDTMRLRSGDGATTEVFTVDAIGAAGAGPNGGTVITTAAALVGTYSPSTDDVDALLRYVVSAGTNVASTQGPRFATLDAVTVGDANPVLDGESTATSLADKAWAECTTRGVSGNVAPLTITAFVTAAPKVRAVLNPERAAGGADMESDADARRRAAYLPSLASQETTAWALALAQRGNTNVLRIVPLPTTRLRTLSFRAITRACTPLSTNERTALAAYIQRFVRSQMIVEITDVPLIAVEVTATITLDTGYTLEQVWRAAASALARHLDLRRWQFDVDVDDADLLRIVDGTTGVLDTDATTFQPANNVAVGMYELPYFTRLVLTDAATGNTMGADLAPTF